MGKYRYHKVIFVLIIITGFVFLSGFTLQPDLDKINEFEVDESVDSNISIFSLILRALFFIIVFAAIAFLAFLTARFYALNRRKINLHDSRFITVLDIVPMDNKTKLAVVKFSGYIFLLGIGENDINLIYKMKDEGDWDIPDDGLNQNISFGNYFDKFKNIISKKRQKSESDFPSGVDLDEIED